MKENRFVIVSISKHQEKANQLEALPRNMNNGNTAHEQVCMFGPQVAAGVFYLGLL